MPNNKKKVVQKKKMEKMIVVGGGFKKISPFLYTPALIEEAHNLLIALSNLGEVAVDLVVGEPPEPRAVGRDDAHLDIRRLEILAQHRLQRVDRHLCACAVVGVRVRC